MCPGMYLEWLVVWRAEGVEKIRPLVGMTYTYLPQIPSPSKSNKGKVQVVASPLIPLLPLSRPSVTGGGIDLELWR